MQLAGTVAAEVCELAELDLVVPIPAGAQVHLHSQAGSSCSPDDFSPNPAWPMEVGGKHIHSTPNGGRSSNLAMPVFGITWTGPGRAVPEAEPGGSSDADSSDSSTGATTEASGLVWMIGWSGNWEQNISRSASGVRIRISTAQSSATGAQFCAAIRPGESFRLGSIAMIPFTTATAANATDVADAGNHGYNRLRGFLRRHVVPLQHIGTPARPPGPPGSCGGSTQQQPAGLMLSANNFDRWPAPKNESQNLWLINLTDAAGLDAYWCDAGWFVGQYPHAGNWRLPLVLTEDRLNFPAGIGSLMETARTNYSLETILWTEPERVGPGTYLQSEFPGYIITNRGGKGWDKRNSDLFNLGDAAARRYMTEFLAAAVQSYGLTVLRFDFNIDPAPFWASVDAPGRQGVAERLYIDGLYTMWDELRARSPGLVLDSCASGGRRIDLEVLSRAVVLSRSDYEFGGAYPPDRADRCQLPADGFPIHDGDYEAQQSMTMGSMQVSAIGFGTAARHYAPYAWRSAGPGAKTVDWGMADWQAVADNTTAMAQLRLAVAESKLLRDIVRDDNEYYPLAGNNPRTDVWSGYQLHRQVAGDGFAMLFRRCHANGSAFTARFAGNIDKDANYTVELRYGYEVARQLTLPGRALVDVGVEVKLRPMASALLRYWKA